MSEAREESIADLVRRLGEAHAERDALARRVEELEQESEGYERSLQYAHADLDALLALGRATKRYKQARLARGAIGTALSILEAEYDALPARLRERLEGE